MGRASVGFVAALAVLGVSVLAFAVTASGTSPITGAEAGVPAERLNDARRIDGFAPERCGRVAVIGDSLTDNARPFLIARLQSAGYTQHVDAHPSREIGLRRPAPYSGVLAVREVRTTWGEADCWVIALGSNDLLWGGGERSAATALIDELLAELTPGARVWWMNVDYHRDPRYSIDFPGRTLAFNAAVADAAAGGRVELIDWYALAEANLNWFFDPVHVNRAGSIARADLTVAALDG